MAKVTRLNVMITASTKGLSLGINKAQGMLRDLNRTARGVKRDMGKAFNGLGTQATRAFTGMGVAAVAAGTGLAYLTKKSIDAIGDANDLAKSLGLTYNELRVFRFAAGQAGVDAEKLDATFAKMADTLGTAFGGNKSAIQAFEKIGLSIADLQRMSPAQQFVAIANAINKIQDPSVKMAAARDILGKSGGSLIALFENAGEAINQAATALQQFGVLPSALDVNRIDAAGDSLNELGLYAEGAGNQLATNFAPYITAAVESLKSWTAAAGGVGPAMDSLIGGALDKMDSLLNKISAVQKAYNDFGAGLTGGIGWAADKAADFASATGTSSSIRKEQENKRLEGIPAHRREQARALLEKQGGFEQEGITARRVSNALNSRSREMAKAGAGIQTNSGYGDQFRNWRLKAEYDANIAAGAVPMAPSAKYKKHVANGYLSNIPGSNNDYESKIPKGIADYKSKIPTGDPNYMNKRPGAGPDSGKLSHYEQQMLDSTRIIAINSGKNKIAFAGP